MDCSNKILPSGTPTQHHRMHKNQHTRSSSVHCQEDQNRRDRSRTQSSYSRHHSSSHCDLAEATPDHNKGMGTAAIEMPQGNPIQHSKATATEAAMMHHTSHITDHPHTTAHQVTTLRTAVDHVHAHHADC